LLPDAQLDAGRIRFPRMDRLLSEDISKHGGIHKVGVPQRILRSQHDLIAPVTLSVTSMANKFITHIEMGAGLPAAEEPCSQHDEKGDLS
jgi:hypothetical protein